MNNVEKIRLGLSSLSVFRGIMSRSVVKALYGLLSSLESEPDEFLRRYGEFFSLLCERGCSDSLGLALTQAALYDENCFSRAAAAGEWERLPHTVLSAVRHDCLAILEAAKLSADELVSAYSRRGELGETEDSLPKWECGGTAGAFCGFDGSLKKLASYYRVNGCGMFARYKAFVWRDGDIQPIINNDEISLDDFTGYERQREKVIENTEAFVRGKTCNNCLLCGDMGTGKSSTVKAVANRFRAQGLRIVEMPKERLRDFPLLVDKIAHLPMRFIIFIDDLSFTRQDESYTALKAVLEGGLAARPDNALIYATSNRRHLVKERLSDRSYEVDDINTRDNMQETLSLSDRFGLTVFFTVPGKKQYLEIVSALAKEKRLDIPKDELELEAERFALAKGGRSPRCAKQFVESLFAQRR